MGKMLTGQSTSLQAAHNMLSESKAFFLQTLPIPAAVCLMEATHRVGGRIYSVRNLGPNGDLVLDMGAYR